MGLFSRALISGDWQYVLLMVLGIVPCVGLLTLFSLVRNRVLYLLGEPMAKINGGFGLNPGAHLHPVGLLLFATTGLGWGKGSVLGKSNLKHPVRGAILAFFLAWGCCLLLSGGCFFIAGGYFPWDNRGSLEKTVLWLLGYTGVLGVSLGLFQWLPLPGFLGYGLLWPYLPSGVQRLGEKWMGQVITLYTVALWTGYFQGGITRLLGPLLEPLCHVMGFPFTAVTALYLS